MNVVGKVGRLIPQGVHSVATRFHPFGGAVDVIVVQQQDGTFRSTPWYVRFGKFQGVLKVAEKFVRINVNGIDADFHMYLDNSGEAYFKKQFVRTNIPTNEQIASLNLKDGQNVITFSFSTRFIGTQQVDAHIYLWKWNARIVISDVDGTITKSDVLGHFMPLVGKDWTQSGVVRLFCAIKENGYQLLYLSARAIRQAHLTRSFLNNLKQDGKALPSGPVVISPHGLIRSLFREVVRRAPHEFKIACLEDIKKLFPNNYNPFYAGFGNRDTDDLSYIKIGIPEGKIFIINPKGEVAISHHRAGDVKSYSSLHTLVNDMFPPTSLVEQSNDSFAEAAPKVEGRTIYYQIAEDNGDVDEGFQGYTLMFKGNGVEELTRKFEEEIGIEGLVVCARSPLKGQLYPLKLHLPPNNVTMQVVVILSSSTAAQDLARKGLL